MQEFPYRKWFRYGLVWKLKEISSPIDVKTIRVIDLETPAYFLLTVLIILLVVFLGILKYRACMEIFHSVWYCVLSK